MVANVIHNKCCLSMPNVRRLDKKISIEGTILLAISFGDILLTLVSISLAGAAIEANPVMALLLNQGIPVFVVWKVEIALMLVLLLELLRARPRLARMVRRWERVAIVCYLSAFPLANIAFPHLGRFAGVPR